MNRTNQFFIWAAIIVMGLGLGPGVARGENPFTPVASSGESHSIVILAATVNGVPLESADWVAVVDTAGVPPSGGTGEVIAAAAAWQANLSLGAALSFIPTSGANPTAGAKKNNTMIFRLYDASAGAYLPATATIGGGPAVFTTDGLTFVTNLAAVVQDPGTDDDGLDDDWEIEHFGSTTAQNGAGDPDQDLLSNIDEFANDSDPGTYTLRLTAGWNLISTARLLDSSAIVGALDGHVVGPVWTWTDDRFEIAAEFDPRKGYWLYAAADASIEIAEP